MTLARFKIILKSYGAFHPLKIYSSNLSSIFFQVSFGISAMEETPAFLICGGAFPVFMIIPIVQQIVLSVTPQHITGIAQPHFPQQRHCALRVRAVCHIITQTDDPIHRVICQNIQKCLQSPLISMYVADQSNLFHSLHPYIRHSRHHVQYYDHAKQ